MKASFVRACRCLVGLLLVGGAAADLGAQTPGSDRPDEEAARRAMLERVEAEHGIRVDKIQLASAGYMLDLRYWVRDADKAWALFRDTRRRELVHAASGARMIVPAPAYVGPMAQTSERPKKDRRYYVFFANPGKLVQAGDTVTVFIGDVEIGPLRVE